MGIQKSLHDVTIRKNLHYNYMNNKDEILVSIICLTYNHEPYIRDAIDGFLKQETTFKFEIIIHDDASRDNTAEIIKDYYIRYPDILNPILQSENKLSKGHWIIHDLILRIAKGKYIALCEGDDYWIDKKKLQKQVECLETDNCCTFCFTNAFVDYNNGKGYTKQKVVPWTKYARKKFDKNRKVYYISDLVHLSLIPTASFLFKKELYLSIPKLPHYCFRGDQYLALYFTSIGYAIFINEQTCVYRRNVVGSATYRWSQIGVDHNKIHPIDKKFLLMYDEFDKMTRHKYHESLEILRIKHTIGSALLKHDWNYLKRKEVKNYIKYAGIKTKIKVFLTQYPAFEKLIHSIYFIIKNKRNS